MPVVTIDMWPRDAAVKQQIIEKVTAVFVDLGVSKDAVTVIIHDVPRQNWGSAGKQMGTEPDNI